MPDCASPKGPKIVCQGGPYLGRALAPPWAFRKESQRGVTRTLEWSQASLQFSLDDNFAFVIGIVAVPGKACH